MTTPAFLERLPPHDLEAEEACVAALMVTASAADQADVFDRLEPEMFFREKNGWIYAACRDLWARSHAINQITVANILASRDQLEAAGGQTYLVELIQRLPTTVGLAFYADIVREAYTYRQLIHATSSIAELAYKAPPGAVNEVLTRAESLLYELRGGALYVPATLPASKVVEDELADRVLAWLDGQPAEQGIPTGWRFLDELIGGWVGGRVHLVSADTSIGKSQFVIDTTYRALCEGYTALVFTTEMSRADWLERLCYRHAGIDREEAKRRGLDDAEKQAIRFAISEWGHGAPLWLNHTATPTIAEARTEAKRRAMTGELDLVVVDHIDRLQPSRRRDDNVAEGVKQVMQALAAIARDFDVPVLAVSHINRDGQEAIDGHNPLGMRHMKDGSAKEQDANVVIILQAGEPAPGGGPQYLNRQQLTNHRASNNGAIPIVVRVEKNRHGDLGMRYFTLSWPRGGRFEVRA